MKKVVFLGSAISLALAAPAYAGEPPAFSSLPLGTITSVPAKRPRAIGGGERMTGFYVGAEGPGRSPFVTADARAAKATLRGEEGTPSICYTTENDPDTEWPGGLESSASLVRNPSDARSAGAFAVHSEKVVEKDGDVSLETVDAFVDPATRGVRLIAKSTLSLRLVGKTFSDLKVYAARDERKDGRRFVTFVVTRSITSSLRTSLQAGLADGRQISSSTCGHLRVSLEVPRNSGGSSIVLTSTAVLPPLASRHGEPDRGAPPAPQGLRRREARIQLGVSKTTRDKEPLLSVSFGWQGRETSQGDFRATGDE